LGCDKNDQKANPSAKLEARPADSSAGLSESGDLSDKSDSAASLSDDSLNILAGLFEEFSKSQDTVYRLGPAWDSLSAIAKERFDFRDCEGSENFTTLKNASLETNVLFGSRPHDGLSYYVLKDHGELLQPPLRFDSLRVKLNVLADGEAVKIPAWHAYSPDSAVNRAVDSLHGKAMVIGSRQPLKGPLLTDAGAEADAAISASLKRLILKSIFPNESMARIFSRIDFHRAGGDGVRSRFVLVFRRSEGDNPKTLCAVEVAKGKCKLLFFIDNTDSVEFLNAYSLTDAPIADVFVARFYESVVALQEVNGRWIGIEFDYNDYYNRD
jgi:hypothetical protein